MATAEPAPVKRTFEWLVIVPDVPGALAKRLEVRPQHLKDADHYVKSGQYKMGGALLDEVPKDDDPSSLKICGSSLVVVAESREEVLEILKGDIYTRTGVWDLDKIQIWPVKTMVRVP